MVDFGRIRDIAHSNTAIEPFELVEIIGDPMRLDYLSGTSGLIKLQWSDSEEVRCLPCLRRQGAPKLPYAFVKGNGCYSEVMRADLDPASGELVFTRLYRPEIWTSREWNREAAVDRLFTMSRDDAPEERDHRFISLKKRSEEQPPGLFDRIPGLRRVYLNAFGLSPQIGLFGHLSHGGR